MTVNGVPRWTCRSHVSHYIQDGSITIEPLRSLPLIKDLVCDMREFFEKWQKVGGRFNPSKTRNDPPELINPESPERIAASEAIECINCAVCYSACDAVAGNKDYAGPAALNRVWTLLNDERHADKNATMETAMAEGGCFSCHSQGNCMRHCPVGLSPAHSIAGIKRLSLFGLAKR